MNPLLLEIGLLPEMCSSTSSFMILVTATGLVIEYSIAGKMLIDYALVLGLLTLISSAFGVILLRKLIRKFKRQSIIVMVLSVILILVTCASLIKGLIELTQDVQEGRNISEFRSLC